MVRQKNRWLLFEIVYESTSATSGSNKSLPFRNPSRSNLTQYSVSNVIRDTIKIHFGSYGAGCIGSSFALKYFSPLTNLGILRVQRDHSRMAWAAMTFIKTIDSRPCMIRVLHISGTIKKCQISAIERDRQLILSMQSKIKITTDLELKKSNDSIMSIES